MRKHFLKGKDFWTITTFCQTQYKKWRHDKIAQVIHWQLCKTHDLGQTEKWYDHHPQIVTENEKVKILWDMNIQTEKTQEYSRPDIVVFEKENRSCKIIVVACPFDTQFLEKEREKVVKYQDLKYELKRIWSCSEVTFIPAVIRDLGTISKEFHNWMNKISPSIYFGTLQKACLLGTARTLRYALNT